jgi:hypothetical protein
MYFGKQTYHHYSEIVIPAKIGGFAQHQLLARLCRRRAFRPFLPSASAHLTHYDQQGL